jgi:hypothetical protein
MFLFRRSFPLACTAHPIFYLLIINLFEIGLIFILFNLAVGRVYTSGEPELTRSLQQYDQSVYLRVAEAQRCHVNCCLFLPVYATTARDRVAAVMEVVQTEYNERFAGLIDWAKVCLEGAGLWTIEAEGDTIGMGLRKITNDFEASAFESKIDARAGGVVRSLTAAAAAPLRPDRIVQVGNQLIISSDAPLQQPNWQTGQNTNNNNTDLSNGNLASGSGGSSEPISQHPIPGVTTNALAAANAAALAVANGAGAFNGAWGGIGGVVTVPQGYATTYGHGDNAITLDDLSPHFHLSLRDAAAKMNISVTTLKRACRRLGLQRWPRRELAIKANEVSQQAAAVAAAADHLFSWNSGQTISADSAGDHHRVAAAAAAAAAAMASGQVQGGSGGIPPFNTRTAAAAAAVAAAAAHHMIHPPVLNTEAQMVFVPGMDPPDLVGNGLGDHSDAAIGDLNTQTHSLESLDILAAADVDTFSVGNS